MLNSLNKDFKILWALERKIPLKIEGNMLCECMMHLLVGIIFFFEFMQSDWNNSPRYIKGTFINVGNLIT